MTFSVSKLETQLSCWCASVLCHVLVYCTNRAEDRLPSPRFNCKRSCRQRPPGTTQNLDLAEDPGEGGKWGSELPPELVKGEGSPGGDPHLLQLQGRSLRYSPQAQAPR